MLGKQFTDGDPFPAGDHKAAREQIRQYNEDKQSNKNDPQSGTTVGPLANDGPTLNAGLVTSCFSREINTSVFKETKSFVIFRWGPEPKSPFTLDPHISDGVKCWCFVFLLLYFMITMP